MSTALFSLFIVYSGVSIVPYTDMTFGQCINRMIIEQDAYALLAARYPDLAATVSCELQQD